MVFRRNRFLEENERAAVEADGGDLAAQVGVVPEVTGSTHRRVGSLTGNEQAAAEAEGGSLASDLGLGPEVTEPTHRIVDLPPGALLFLNDDQVDHTTGAILNVRDTMTGDPFINERYGNSADSDFRGVPQPMPGQEVDQ